MRIKKYRAKDMKEALVQIKQDFGSDAVILHSRNVIVGGVMGFFGKEMVEVTAGSEINLLEDSVPKKKPQFNIEKNVAGISSYNKPANEKWRSAAPAMPDVAPPKPRVAPIVTPAVEILEKPVKPEPAVVVEQNGKIDDLSSQVKRLEKQMDSLTNNLSVVVNNIKAINMKNFNKNVIGIFEYLLRCGIKDEVASTMIEKIENEMSGNEIKDQEKVEKFLYKELLSYVKTSGPIEVEGPPPRKIAFIGATGVGKTTTIAKLAANYSLMQKKNIALITVDTYRIAAIEQLKTYASIIGVPIDVVFTPQELKQTLAMHKDKDLVLIDTAGRSPKNKEQMKELRKFLEAGGADMEKYLVLSATSKYEDIQDTINRFDIIETEKVVFTKLDETSSIGVIINVLHDHEKKIAYISTGQNVPDDLEVVKDSELVEKIMGQSQLQL